MKGTGIYEHIYLTILTTCKQIYVANVQDNISYLVYCDINRLFCISHFPTLHAAQQTKILPVPNQDPVILVTYGYSIVENVKRRCSGEYLNMPCMKCDYSFLSFYLNYAPVNSQETVLAIKFDNKTNVMHICSPKHFLVWPNSKGYQAKCTINSTHNIISKVVMPLILQLDVSMVYAAYSLPFLPPKLQTLLSLSISKISFKN